MLLECDLLSLCKVGPTVAPWLHVKHSGMQLLRVNIESLSLENMGYNLSCNFDVQSHTGVNGILLCTLMVNMKCFVCSLVNIIIYKSNLPLAV